jgi:hypothetical protein
MICSIEATSRAPQKPLVIVVRGRCFPLGSGPAHTRVAPQALPIVLRYAVSAPLISSQLYRSAGSSLMQGRVRVPEASDLQTTAVSDLAEDNTRGILIMSKKNVTFRSHLTGSLFSVTKSETHARGINWRWEGHSS